MFDNKEIDFIEDFRIILIISSEKMVNRRIYYGKVDNRRWYRTSNIT